MLAAVWLLAGCDGAVRRTLPDSVRRLSVRPFQNLSDQGLLPSHLDEEIRRAVRLDGRLTVAEQSAEAQAVLDGAIAEYVKEPARYDANNIVQEYRLRVGVDVTLTDPAVGRTLWLAPGVSATAAEAAAPAGKPLPHRLTRTITFTVVPASGLPVETEEDAQRRAARDLAADIVHKVLEGF